MTGHAMNDFDAMMSADSPTTPDRLAAIRAAAVRRRDLGLERTSLEDRLTNVNKEAEVLERETLPDLFAAAGVDRVDVAADGNMPGFVATLSPYYRANIPASWTDEARAAGFARLDDIGLGDIIKNVVTITFGRDEDAAVRALRDLLDANGVRYSVARSVPWQTLTAAVKDIYEDGKTLDAGDLAAIGAVVGRIVRLK